MVTSALKKPPTNFPPTKLIYSRRRDDGYFIALLFFKKFHRKANLYPGLAEPYKTAKLHRRKSPGH